MTDLQVPDEIERLNSGEIPSLFFTRLPFSKEQIADARRRLTFEDAVRTVENALSKFTASGLEYQPFKGYTLIHFWLRVANGKKGLRIEVRESIPGIPGWGLAELLSPYESKLWREITVPVLRQINYELDGLAVHILTKEQVEPEGDITLCIDEVRFNGQLLPVDWLVMDNQPNRIVEAVQKLNQFYAPSAAADGQLTDSTHIGTRNNLLAALADGTVEVLSTAINTYNETREDKTAGELRTALLAMGYPPDRVERAIEEHRREQQLVEHARLEREIERREAALSEDGQTDEHLPDVVVDLDALTLHTSVPALTVEGERDGIVMIRALQEIRALLEKATFVDPFVSMLPPANAARGELMQPNIPRKPDIPQKPVTNSGLAMWFDYYHKCKRIGKSYTLKEVAKDTNLSYGYVRQEHGKYKIERGIGENDRLND